MGRLITFDKDTNNTDNPYRPLKNGETALLLTIDEVEKTADFTAVANYSYSINSTASAIKIKFPASADSGATIVLQDTGGAAASNNITIRNSTDTTTLTILNTNSGVITFTYNKVLTKWVINSSTVVVPTKFSISTSVGGTITSILTAAEKTDTAGAEFSILNTSTSLSITLTATAISGYTAYPANATSTSILIPPGQLALIQTETVGSQYRLIVVGGQGVNTGVATAVPTNSASVPTNTVVSVPLTAQSDVNGWVANNRITPKIAGWYLITGALYFAGNGASSWDVEIQLYKNGNLIKIGLGNTAGANVQTSVNWVVYLDGVSDYISFGAYQATSGTMATIINTNLAAFSCVLLNVPSSSTQYATKASGLVNAGVPVTLGNLKVQIPTSGARSLQVATVSGTYSIYGAGTYVASGQVGAAEIGNANPVSVTTTMAYIVPGMSFVQAGDTITWLLMDTSARISWRISMIVGAGYNNNMISIEQLV